MAWFCEKCGKKKNSNEGKRCKSCSGRGKGFGDKAEDELSLQKSQEAYNLFRWNIIMGCPAIKTVKIPLLKSAKNNA